MFIHLKHFIIQYIMRFANTMRTCPGGLRAQYVQYYIYGENERCASLTGSVACVNGGSAMSTFYSFYDTILGGTRKSH